MRVANTLSLSDYEALNSENDYETSAIVFVSLSPTSNQLIRV